MVEIGARTELTVHPLLSSIVCYRRASVNLAIFSLQFTGIYSILGAVNFISRIINIGPKEINIEKS